MASTLRWIGVLLVVCGGAWEWRYVASRPCCVLLIPPWNAPALVNGMAVSDFYVSWYGPLVTVSWRVSGRRRMRLVFFPDILPVAMWRELRLVMRARQLSCQVPLMAP
ncbi:MAG TPA: hypothetical protein ACQGQH_05705 [Xylella sp.]